MIRARSLPFMLIAAVALLPRVAGALELGLTPSNVFALWANVNTALVTLAGTYSADPDRVGQIEEIKSRAFTDKKPADVLQRVAVFRDKLDRLKRMAGANATVSVSRTQGERITPSMVFLSSGYVLDSLVMLVVHQTTVQQLITPFYSGQSFAGKTPSDVYALVDAADRRIDRILEKAGAPQ